MWPKFILFTRLEAPGKNRFPCLFQLLEPPASLAHDPSLCHAILWLLSSHLILLICQKGVAVPSPGERGGIEGSIPCPSQVGYAARSWGIFLLRKLNDAHLELGTPSWFYLPRVVVGRSWTHWLLSTLTPRYWRRKYRSTKIPSPKPRAVSFTNSNLTGSLGVPWTPR